jgi:hypothetical protein
MKDETQVKKSNKFNYIKEIQYIIHIILMYIYKYIMFLYV